MMYSQTPIHDVLLNPTDTSTSTVTGTLSIVSSAIDVNGNQIVKTLTPIKIVAGVLNFTLAPNDTANSLNSYYTANYSINEVGNPKVTTNYSQRWQVPTSVSPLTVHDILVNTSILSPVSPVLLSQIVTGLTTKGVVYTTITGSLAVAVPPSSGTYCWTSVSGTMSWASCSSGGGSSVSWVSMTNSDWTSLTNSQWTGMTN